MEEYLNFIDFKDLDEVQIENLKLFLSPTTINPNVELPWDNNFEEDNFSLKDNISFVNTQVTDFRTSSNQFISPVASEVYAAKLPCLSSSAPQQIICHIDNPPHNVQMSHLPLPACHVPPSNTSCVNASSPNLYPHAVPTESINSPIMQFQRNGEVENYSSPNQMRNSNASQILTNEVHASVIDSSPVLRNNVQHVQSFSAGNVNILKNSQLNPLVSCFVPQNINIPAYTQATSSLPNSVAPSSLTPPQVPLLLQSSQVVQNMPERTSSLSDTESGFCDEKSAPVTLLPKEKSETKECDLINQQTVADSKVEPAPPPVEELQEPRSAPEDTAKLNAIENHSVQKVVSPIVSRSWADVLKSNKFQPNTPASPVVATTADKVDRSLNKSASDKEAETCTTSIEEDKMSFALGGHLYQLCLDYTPVLLQPRGLINRRNWCYINASIQALLACSPFYTLLRNLPLGPTVDRGKSCTPVLDSMVKLVYEFVQVPAPQEDMKPGQSFQPTQIYEMLSMLKPDCIKGQQEDAEEFLSYILNGMHEEMVAVIKNFEKQRGYDTYRNEITTNGHADMSEGEEDWKVMGARQKGIVTRLVAEQKSPISELLGGQIKSFLTTNNGNTSACIQPFFTLQLDIQSENVTSVKEALNQMTIKEPIQGYTCAKTKQEVEAYSRITIQKLPPVLILHLKRFIYDKNGGCKKVMKKTEYPINLEFKKELFSAEAKRANKSNNYTLFAVMYHDGEEAIKGHYISDIYHHGSKSWIRCDDRSIATITEDQVLSYNPPRVPYLLFYQINNSNDTKL